MRYIEAKDCFLFEKDKAFLSYLLERLENGVIKEYPDIYCLEPIPEIMVKGEYDWIIFDGKVISWDGIYQYTKDRLRILTGVEEKKDTIKIEAFYSKKYDSYDMDKMIKQYRGAEKDFFDHKFTKEILGFEMRMTNARHE